MQTHSYYIHTHTNYIHTHTNQPTTVLYHTHTLFSVDWLDTPSRDAILASD